jgi:secreted trypsin-like serine protease
LAQHTSPSHLQYLHSIRLVVDQVLSVQFSTMTARLSVFILQLLAVLSRTSEADSRLRERHEERELQRIVGGQVVNATNNIYPWFTLYANGECAGVLISERRVLTSASCVQSGHPFSVRVGASTRANGQRVGVRCAKSHPLYQWPNFQYDIAVLKLEEPVTGIEFALRNRVTNYPSIVDQPVLVAGFGRNFTSGFPSDQLVEVRYGFVPEDLCKQFFGDNITKGLHVCADGVNQGSEYIIVVLMPRSVVLFKVAAHFC